MAGKATHYFEMPGSYYTAQVWLTFNTLLHNQLFWAPGKEFSTRHVYSQDISLRVELKNVSASWAYSVVDARGESDLRTQLVMSAIENTGKLSIDHKPGLAAVIANVVPRNEGILIDALRSLGGGVILDLASGAFGRNRVTESMKQAMRHPIQEMFMLAKSFGDVLNDQTGFILPGAGTFDMKDPMLNDSRDLMIGLTHRE